MDAKSMIINKLAQYLSKEIQREELYKYAIDMIHKLLKGDILQLEKFFPKIAYNRGSSNISILV